MKTLIYKDEENNKIYINNDIIELITDKNCENNCCNNTVINLNKDFISGNKDNIESLLKWLYDAETELDTIIYEISIGNYNFNLINVKLNLN